MNVRNCRKCGKLFNYVAGPPTCPECRQALEEKFQEVKKYIQEHKTASIPEVSKECDVEVGQIQAWLREERLELCEGSGITLSCETCGQPILAGRFCDKCKANMVNQFNNSIRKPEQLAKPQQKESQGNPKMRFLS